MQVPSCIFSLRLVSVHVVHPYSSMDTIASRKNLPYILSDRVWYYTKFEESTVAMVEVKHITRGEEEEEEEEDCCVKIVVVQCVIIMTRSHSRHSLHDGLIIIILCRISSTHRRVFYYTLELLTIVYLFNHILIKLCRLISPLVIFFSFFTFTSHHGRH